MDNNTLLNEVIAKAQIWLDGNYNEETKKEVRRLLEAEDKSELIESFYRDLEFGTGGLRGIMGVGTNRMNIYTVGAATQGLSNYLKAQFPDVPQLSVVIGHDCRNNSRLFSEISANIFSANGIKVYLFEDLRPTPEASFAIRHLGCQSGIILTASHNPKEYNGYKAYWNDGAQMVAPHDENVITEVNKIASVDDIKFEGNPALIEIIGEEIDKLFIENIKKLSLSPESIKRNSNLKIVYTPIHGTGVKLIPRALKEYGFTNIIAVPEQNVVSGNFPTVVSPNPEEPAALDMAVKKAIETDADIVMASDPDADRLGIAVKNDKGEWILVNGNQTALLFIYYLIRRWKELGKLNGNQYIVKTIVTTEIIKQIAERNGVEMFDCFTGFKWIAAVIRENEGKKEYIGGGEESYGFLPEEFARDKDAVSSCTVMAEIAAWAKDNGKTLFELLQDIYVEYGYGKEKGISVVRKGKSGAEEIAQMMRDFRSNPPKEIAGSKVKVVKDYDSLKMTDLDSGKVSDLIMPATSNVLQYFTEDGTKISVRPSGTEPKIKFYIEVRGAMTSRADYDAADAAANKKIEAVRASLGV
ncbi:phosphoglucomutase/phosphomannomutase alpha/beta/alpha domain I [Paludibacter propionicigenes WB4]|uniref:Phosphoglucomutase/phosphomannomutase alpha/beta/alpha domain I n=1 Tax=Paludibacter propionicigenes (strain DSM 17365 / JCM 13257 / WB4) TaxID=694427 RepID=E4T2R2_PALPW|nr:phospho-sugar mutase [Paludibacter propionicigenes]ADQ79006.1 phosphoglucomutase/phosphomannomutase alpha/beta/alpha domain I [Paludibacter propionicigenes WB4]